MAKKFKNSLDDFNMASVVSGDEATNTSKKEVAKTKKEKTVRVDNSVKLTNGERATIGAARSTVRNRHRPTTSISVAMPRNGAPTVPWDFQ